MSVENDGIPLTWEEVKEAYRQLLCRGRSEELQEAKRWIRAYLEHEQSEDFRAKEQIALPGYN